MKADNLEIRLSKGSFKKGLIITGHLLAAPVLGALPEQKYLEDKISYYKHSVARTISGFVEGFAGIGYAALTNSGIGILVGLDGLYRAIKPTEEIEEVKDNIAFTKKEFSEEFRRIVKKPRGSYFLEIPWNLGKYGIRIAYTLRKKGRSLIKVKN